MLFWTSLWVVLVTIWSILQNFLDSSFFIAFVTFTVGLLAWIIYKQQKHDFKTDAANIILLEIENAERLPKKAKEALDKDNGSLLADILLMQTESWSKYKYLFVRDFNRDEWDTINDFYNKCQLYDQAVEYNNSFFQKNEEQIRVNIQRILADYAKEFVEDNFNAKTAKTKTAVFTKNINLVNDFRAASMNDRFLNLYSPIKPVTDAKLYVKDLSTSISTTTLGAKLKGLAKLKN